MKKKPRGIRVDAIYYKKFVKPKQAEPDSKDEETVEPKDDLLEADTERDKEFDDIVRDFKDLIERNNSVGLSPFADDAEADIAKSSTGKRIKKRLKKEDAEQEDNDEQSPPEIEPVEDLEEDMDEFSEEPERKRKRKRKKSEDKSWVSKIFDLLK